MKPMHIELTHPVIPLLAYLALDLTSIDLVIKICTGLVVMGYTVYKWKNGK